MRALLAAHPTVGHTNALRAIGRTLRERGHSVAFATTVVRAPPRWLPAPEVLRTAASIPAALVRDGFELVPLRPSLGSLRHAVMIPGARGYVELRHALGMFAADTVGHARALACAIDRLDADVVVGDYLMFGAYLGARLRRRPFAAFYHSALPFPGPDRPPFGSGLPHDAPRGEAWSAARREVDALGAAATGSITRACGELGLAPPTRRLLAEPYSEHCNLLATTRALEPGLPEPSGPVHFVGPCLEGRVEDERHSALDALGSGGTRVYVSMGTVFDTNRGVLEAILRGLARPGVRVVVSAGASFEAFSRAPPTRNAVFFVRVPQLAVLRAVDVMVGHGGNNSTLEALAAGTPLVVVPFGGDQLENARRVEALGTRGARGLRCVRGSSRRSRPAPRGSRRRGRRARPPGACTAGPTTGARALHLDRRRPCSERCARAPSRATGGARRSRTRARTCASRRGTLWLAHAATRPRERARRRDPAWHARCEGNAGTRHEPTEPTMTRTMLLTAFTLALLGCVAESQGDSPTTATGDANAAIIECACPAETLEWTSKGGSGVNYVTKVAACAKATLTRSYPDAQNNPVVQSCEDEVASCGAAGLVTTADLAKALGQPDVKLAFAEAQKLGEPARFGLFAPDVWDFPDLEVTVDGATVMFGYPCGGQQGCKDPPAGLATLSTILNMIDHAMRSEATCDAKLGTDPTIGVK